MRRVLCVAGLSLVALLVTSAAHAQQQPVGPPSLRLTLEEAQERAVRNSHRIAEARARESIARAGVDARVAMDRPSVAANAGYMRTNHVLEFALPGPGGFPRVVYPDVPNNFLSRIDMQWPIYSGGRTDALERAARADASVASREIEITRADLRLEVARAYWAIVTARASVDVLDQAVARADSHLGDVTQRFDAGLVAPNETASAEAQLARTRMLRIEAQNQRAASIAELERLVGAETGVSFEPASPLEPAAATSARGPRAQDGNADRQALRDLITSAEALQVAAAASRKPTLAAVAGFDYARPNSKIFPRIDDWNETWDVGVRLTWSLWDGGRTDAEVAQAAGAAVAARERLAEFDSRRALDVRLRELDISSGRAAVDAATVGVRAAAEARRVVTERYRAGVAPQGDVLDAELALVQAELDRTRALATVRFAEARLARVEHADIVD